MVWSPASQADLARIDDFNAARDMDFAERVARAAIAAGDLLLEFPLAGPIADRDDRKWRVPGTDYVLVYRVAADGIEILRVYHGRENWRIDP